MAPAAPLEDLYRPLSPHFPLRAVTGMGEEEGSSVTFTIHAAKFPHLGDSAMADRGGLAWRLAPPDPLPLICVTHGITACAVRGSNIRASTRRAQTNALYGVNGRVSNLYFTAARRYADGAAVAIAQRVAARFADTKTSKDAQTPALWAAMRTAGHRASGEQTSAPTPSPLLTSHRLLTYHNGTYVVWHTNVTCAILFWLRATPPRHTATCRRLLARSLLRVSLLSFNKGAGWWAWTILGR